MDTNEANSFIFWYDISAVALAKFVALSKIPSGTFRNVLNAMIFVFSVAKLGKDLNGVCLEIIVLSKLQRYIKMDLQFRMNNNKFC